jgi:transcriptional antiterminator Rof (Rho-off)
MLDMPTVVGVEGVSLRRLIQDVHDEFVVRCAYDEFELEFRQANCVRVVALDMFDRKSPDEQVAVVADLLCHNGEMRLLRGDKTTVFASAESPGEIIVDLVCEIVWQVLMRDHEVRVEDEIRLALAYC